MRRRRRRRVRRRYRSVRRAGPRRRLRGARRGCRRPAAVEHREREREQPRGAGVAELGAQDLVADDADEHPGDEERGRQQPQRRRLGRLTARERRLVERAGGQMQAHAHGDQGEAKPLVAVVVVEEVMQHERPDREQADRDGEREGRDREHGHADRAGERGATLGDLEAGEMGKQRGLDRLEQLQRRACDQQHVEDDPWERRSGPLDAAIVSTAAFSSVCSASWMPETEIAKPLPRRIDRSLTASSIPSAAGPSSAASLAAGARSSRAARLANAAGTTTSDTKGAAAIPRPIADCPWLIPTAAASAKAKREADSMNTSPP